MVFVSKQYWWNGSSNFGDLIGPDIVSSLLGSKLSLAKGGDADVLLGPGSIIEYCNKFKSAVVWGSGIDPHYSKRQSKPYNAVYLAVRGPLTREYLNLDIQVLGDPGLLLPRIYPKTPKGGPVSILPHHSTFKRRLRDFLFDPFRSKYRVIDPRRPWQEVIDDICESDFLFCQSLHGAIVAETYGIPWAWWKGFHGQVASFKWRDWFASIGTAPKSFLLRDYSSAMKWRANTKTTLPDLNALEQSLTENIQIRELPVGTSWSA